MIDTSSATAPSRIDGMTRRSGIKTGSVTAARLDRRRPTGCMDGTWTHSRIMRMMRAAMKTQIAMQMISIYIPARRLKPGWERLALDITGLLELELLETELGQALQLLTTQGDAGG